MSENADAPDHDDRRPLPRRLARPDHAGYDRQLTGQLHLSGEDGEVFVPACSIEDTETQRDLLCDQITVPVPSDWVGRPGRTMTVKGIEDILVHD